MSAVAKEVDALQRALGRPRGKKSAAASLRQTGTALELLLKLTYGSWTGAPRTLTKELKGAVKPSAGRLHALLKKIRDAEWVFDLLEKAGEGPVVLRALATFRRLVSEVELSTTRTDLWKLAEEETPEAVGCARAERALVGLRRVLAAQSRGECVIF